MSGPEYKRATLAAETDNAMAATESAPQIKDDTVSDTPPSDAPAQENTAPDFMAIFKKAADALPESERKIFIDAELSRLRELEDAQKRIEANTTETAKLKEEHKKQIKETMGTIR